MCGIVGVFSSRAKPVSLDEHGVARLRDRLAHRGPDGAGTWFSPRRDAVLSHRRLAVLEPPPSRGGAQPMFSACGRYCLVYNGELYNDADLRAELEQQRARFHTHCDTETVLAALIAWGEGALSRFRGMFALAFYDHERHTLLLARDPLGIKPLYYTQTAREFVFASELPAILAHPGVDAKPDAVTVSAYLSTIRTTLGRRTFYAGVSSLQPGEAARVFTDDAGVTQIDTFEYTNDDQPPRWDVRGDAIPAHAVERLRELMSESVALHLRSDVPTCCLLSGGLDSTIITHEAVSRHQSLHTFCAGAASARLQPGSDLEVARRMAQHFKTTHHEALLTPESFVERWAWMVDRLGVPLGTPNEVAIYDVAACLREQGCVVTLSGEGADELFAGYDVALAAVVGVSTSNPTMHPGSAHLAATAWNPPPSSIGDAQSMKPLVLTDAFWNEAQRDEQLVGHYCNEFEAAWMADTGVEQRVNDRTLAAHQRLLRRVNLTGLLQRLDSSTMLAGVEGRTPFADAKIAAFAESLPMAWKCVLSGSRGEGVPATAATKRILRDAYVESVPNEAIERPKASFPLPFQQWAAAAVEMLDPGTDGYLQQIVRPEAMAMVHADPVRHWQWAWPMINLAMWGKKVNSEQ